MKKRIPIWKIVIGLFFGFAIINAAIEQVHRPGNPVAAAKMAAENAAAEQVAAQRQNLAARCLVAVKRSLQYPDSADFDAAYGGQIHYRTQRDGVKLLQFQFRAKNGFNAVRTATATCKFDMKNSDGGKFTYEVS